MDRIGDRPEDPERLETLRLTERELADLDMLASGRLPLEGFMGSRDYRGVLDEMRLESAWPGHCRSAWPPSAPAVTGWR